MSKAAKKSILFALAALVLIGFAMWVRWASRSILHHVGWVYLRTRNVWAVTAAHFLNNNLGLMLFGVSAAGVTLGWGDTVLSVLLYMVVYLPFLLTKEYRKGVPEQGE